MTKPWTIQLAFAVYQGATVTVEAETLEDAIPAAIRHADDNERWKDTGHAADPFCVAACEGADADPGNSETPLPVPDRFSEHGEPPIITVTDPARPDGAIEVTRGRVLLRFKGDSGTVTAEVADPPHPPVNKPHVTVSLDARGNLTPRFTTAGLSCASSTGRPPAPPSAPATAGAGSTPPGGRAGFLPDGGGPGRGSVPGFPRPATGNRRPRHDTPRRP